MALIIPRRKFLIGGAASLIASPAIARLMRGSPGASGSNLVINLSYDTSWTGNLPPAHYQTDVVWARDAIVAAFPNTAMTLTIRVGYQFMLNVIAVNPSESAGGPVAEASNIAYTTARAACVAKTGKPAAFSTMVSNLPAGSSIGGVSTFFLNWTSLKTLGMFGLSGGPTSANDTSQVEGAIGIGTGWTSAKTKGVFLHEITHGMGRAAAENIASFSRLTGVGAWDIAGTSTSAYFSIDGGTSNLANFAASSDIGDYATGTVDPGSGLDDCFNIQQSNTPAEFLTQLDINQMNAMGIY